MKEAESEGEGRRPKRKATHFYPLPSDFSKGIEVNVEYAVGGK